jgi:hypothetical protein
VFALTTLKLGAVLNLAFFSLFGSVLLQKSRLLHRQVISKKNIE